MKQYKLPLTVNKGRRKRAAPNLNNSMIGKSRVGLKFGYITALIEVLNISFYL